MTDAASAGERDRDVRGPSRLVLWCCVGLCYFEASVSVIFEV
ncbi:hypothetical protein B0I08_106101 [Glaciihabitans tibetensis]|uniref:Uncharacterized protein n=1 Tax=Glaciihabitans tibetensis TaxID=1266600 RepID=A0A2T0VBF9_9MICO|nr:hypothetical protein B0I08_106101 [Glaciihabitans tibetensis]